MVGKKPQALWAVNIIVDANIIFSAILNTQGKLGDILMNSGRDFNFIAPYFLKTEIHKHYPKLGKVSGLTTRQIKEAETLVCKNIVFISEEQIEISTWHKAILLTADIDSKDAIYIAFSLHFRCMLWSGDKALIKGLTKNGFDSFITTNELYKLKE